MGTGMASVVFIKPVWSCGLRAGASGSFRGVFPAPPTCIHVGDITVAAAPELLMVPSAPERSSPVVPCPPALQGGGCLPRHR